MPALSELLEQAKNLRLPLRMLGVDLDELKMRHAPVCDDLALDRALDYLDDLATVPGAETALFEVEFRGARGVALVVIPAPAIEGAAIPAPTMESRQLTPAEDFS